MENLFFENDVQNKLELENKIRQNHSLWVEKYRPLSLDDFVGNQHIKDKVKIFIEQNDIPHLLFIGKAGGGKTSLGNLILKNIECDSIKINASDENSIDVIRNKITRFATTTGLRNLKVVFLDECLDENTTVDIIRNGEFLNIPIKDLNDKEDLVKSYNIEKDEIQWRPFYLIDKGMSDVYDIEFENGEHVLCTDTHKWYVYDSNNNIISVKTSDFISGKYNYILTD